MKKTGLLALCAAPMFITGCASYSITQIPKSEQEWGTTHKDGYVLYAPELYFLVAPSGGQKTDKPQAGTKDDAKKDDTKKEDNKSDGTSGAGQTNQPQYTVTPIYLPNYRKAYTVTTHNFLAKSDFAFSFTDGWQLKSIADKADNTTIANTIAGQLKSILSAAGFAFVA